MDIKVLRDENVLANGFESSIREKLSKYFTNYPFVESIKVFLRGKRHKSKKIKLQVRLKGKDVFVEANGHNHEYALEQATDKLYTQVEKYKSKRYR